MSKTNSGDFLKFEHLELENFKNLDKYLIDIGGRSFIIFGKNQAGKSSLIQALTSPLNSKLLPSKSIKKGEESAKVEVVLAGQLGGVPKKYILTMYFTPGKQSGRLVVTNEAGDDQKAPANFVKSLIGNVSFDITAWLNEPKEKKLKMLKALTGCEEAIDLINSEIKTKKTEIKIKKDRAEEMEHVVKNHGYSNEDLDKYSTKINIQELQASAEQEASALTQYNEIETKTRVTFPNEIKSLENQARACNAEIERLQTLLKAEEDKKEKCLQDIETKRSNIQKGEAWLAQVKKPDVAAQNARVNEAILHNQHCDTIQAFAEKQREMLRAKDEVLKIESEVEVLEKKRSETISKSQLPIEGMSFSEDEIFIDGLPFEEGQQNTARIMDIGIDVAIALNPVLKVIFINEGSLFDLPTLKTVLQKIESKGYMAIAEYVDPQGGDLQIKFTETFLNQQ